MCATTLKPPSTASIPIEDGLVRSDPTHLDNDPSRSPHGGSAFRRERRSVVSVGWARLLSAPGLRAWGTAGAAASVWHGQTFSNERAAHVPTVNEQRAAEPPEIALIRAFCPGSTGTGHALKFNRRRTPYQLTETRCGALPDLPLRSAGRPPSFRRVKPDETHVRCQASNIDRITINDPYITGSKRPILGGGSLCWWRHRRQESGRHPARPQIGPNLCPLPFIAKLLDAGPLAQDAHHSMRGRRPSTLVDPCPCHIDESRVCRLRCGYR